MKYQIGDVVWYAARTSSEERMVCPDCCGKKYLTVTMGDDSQVTIDCAGCTLGFEPPRGYVTYTVQGSVPRRVVIDRLEVNSEQERYGFNGCYLADASELFDVEEDARKRGVELAEQWKAEQLARINMKEKNTRTWAWNATYHRKCIKSIREQIAYHEAKLNAALKHAKEAV